MSTVNENKTLVNLPIMKFERKYLLYLIISRFYVFSSVWLIFLYSLGYSLQTVLLFNFLTITITITFEIPAGFIAETFGQKQTLLGAYSIYLMSVLILLLNFSFPFLVLSNIFWGIGNSLSVDTEDIWLYNQLLVENNLDQKKSENEFSKIYNKFIFLGFFSTGVAEIIGSLSFSISVTIPILISAGMMLLTIYWVQIIPSIPVHLTYNSEIDKAKGNYLKELHEFIRIPIFKQIVAFIVLNSILFSIIVWFPNYLISLNLKPTLVSATIGCGTFVIGLGIILSSKLVKSTKADTILKFLLFLIPILLINVTLQTNFLIIITFFMIQAIYGSLIPYYRVKVILNLPHNNKTVYLSIIGVFSLIIYVAVDVLTGLFVMLDFKLYFLIVASFLALFVIPVIVISLNHRQKNEKEMMN